MPNFKFSPGHCGTGDCGCTDPCADACLGCCADPATTEFQVHISNGLCGDDDITLTVNPSKCVWYGCWHRTTCGAGLRGIAVVLDLNYSPPKMFLWYAYAVEGCTGSHSTYEIPLTTADCIDATSPHKTPRHVYTQDPSGPFYAQGYREFSITSP